MLCHQIPPNLQLNWIKRFYRAKQKQWFRDKVEDYTDESGLHFIKFDFVTGGQEIKIIMRVEFLLFLAVILSY